jgi:hypothetical protein
VKREQIKKEGVLSVVLGWGYPSPQSLVPTRSSNLIFAIKKK